MNPNIFENATILLPDFGKVDGTKWATVACDQYTGEPTYWKRTEELVGNAPSTLRLMLPEVYLGESAERIPQIHAAMEAALRETLNDIVAVFPKFHTERHIDCPPCSAFAVRYCPATFTIGQTPRSAAIIRRPFSEAASPSASA